MYQRYPQAVLFSLKTLLAAGLWRLLGRVDRTLTQRIFKNSLVSLAHLGAQSIQAWQKRSQMPSGQGLSTGPLVQRSWLLLSISKDLSPVQRPKCLNKEHYEALRPAWGLWLESRLTLLRTLEKDLKPPLRGMVRILRPSVNSRLPICRPWLSRAGANG